MTTRAMFLLLQTTSYGGDRGAAAIGGRRCSRLLADRRLDLVTKSPRLLRGFRAVVAAAAAAAAASPWRRVSVPFIALASSGFLKRVLLISPCCTPAPIARPRVALPANWFDVIALAVGRRARTQVARFAPWRNVGKPKTKMGQQSTYRKSKEWMPQSACDVSRRMPEWLQLTGMRSPIVRFLERANGIGEAFERWEGVSRFRRLQWSGAWWSVLFCRLNRAEKRK